MNHDQKQQSKNVPQKYLQEIKRFEKWARQRLQIDGRLESTAVLGNFTTRRMTLVPFDVTDEIGKDCTAVTIRMNAARIQAVFIVNIMDAWVLKQGYEHRYREVFKQVGSIANSPYGERAIAFTVETHDGCWIATSAYKSNACSQKGCTFGPLEFVSMDGFRGRFGGLLDRKSVV